MNAPEVQCRHSWVWAPDQPGPRIRFVCEWCPEEAPQCRHCTRVVSGNLAVCRACVTYAHRVVDGITEALGQIPDPHATILGLAPTGGAIGSSAQDREALPFGLDAVFDDPDVTGLNGVRTPRGLLHVLVEIAEDWLEHRAGVRDRAGLVPGKEDVDVDDVAPGQALGLVRALLLWALQTHPAWLEQLQALEAVRAHARHLAGLNPLVEPVPCVYCHGNIVRRWTVHGLDDEHVCTRCGRTWPNAAAYWFVARQALHSLAVTHPDSLVTIEEARRVLPAVRAGTIRVVLHRDQRRDPEARRLPERGRDVRGNVLYRLGDIAALARDDTPGPEPVAAHQDDGVLP